MKVLDFAIRKSEGAINRVIFLLVVAAVAVLGLVWLSIAATSWLALIFSPPAAAAITGGVILFIAGIAYLSSRSARPDTKSEIQVATNPRNEDLISRATRAAERMVPDSPIVAVLVALLAGLISVRLPAEMTPFLNKILDDFENKPENHIRPQPDRAHGTGSH